MKLKILFNSELNTALVSYGDSELQVLKNSEEPEEVIETLVEFIFNNKPTHIEFLSEFKEKSIIKELNRFDIIYDEITTKVTYPLF